MGRGVTWWLPVTLGHTAQRNGDKGEGLWLTGQKR